MADLFCPLSYTFEYSETNSFPGTAFPVNGAQTATDIFFQNDADPTTLPEFAYSIQKAAATNAVAKTYYIQMTATVIGSTLPAAESTLTLVYEHRIIPDCAGETITTAAQADISYIKGDPVKSTLLPLFTAPYGCPIRYTLCFMDKKLAAPVE